MNRNHLLLIGIVFILGLFVGGIVVSAVLTDKGRESKVAILPFAAPREVEPMDHEIIVLSSTENHTSHVAEFYRVVSNSDGVLKLKDERGKDYSFDHDKFKEWSKNNVVSLIHRSQWGYERANNDFNRKLAQNTGQ